MPKGYILVEGRGEVSAVQNLVSRISCDLVFYLPWDMPRRWKNLHQRENEKTGGAIRGAKFIRQKPDAAALLILRDEDDGCPRDVGPVSAGWLRSLNLPFPSAFVLLKPEYEVLFLPCLERMAGKSFSDGRRGLLPGTKWMGGWENKRDVKGWLSEHYPENRTYKETLRNVSTILRQSPSAI